VNQVTHLPALQLPDSKPDSEIEIASLDGQGCHCRPLIQSPAGTTAADIAVKRKAIIAAATSW
jgi:hypothetical protein